MGRGSGVIGVQIRNNHIRITIDHEYKRYSKTLKIEPTPANIKYAERMRSTWLHELEKGSIPSVFQDRQTSKVKVLLDNWIDGKIVKASTMNDYIKSVRLLKEHFGDYDAAALEISHVRNFCKASNATAKRLNNLLSPLRMALQEAYEDKIIDKNILNGWTYKKPVIEEREDPIDPFTQNEQIAILNATDGQGRNLLQFAFWTGMRTSELVGLCWSDIDMIEGKVEVRRARTQASTKPETTKTNAGRRIIELLPPALAAIKAQKAHTFLNDKEVFLNPRTNEPWSGDAPIRKTLWIPALKKAGVRYRNPYQTRHTFASMMLSAGEHPMWVANKMGHKDWSMIARRYGKWMPEAMPDAGQKAIAAFWNDEDKNGIEYG